MEIAFFDTRSYDKISFTAESSKNNFRFLEARLTKETAHLAQGCKVACCFVNDHLDAQTLETLKAAGVELIALRSAGYNHVDLNAAKKLNLPVVRVPEYSPYAVAEHALALLQTFNRKTHRAYNRVHEMNFSLDGLVGFDLHGKTVGILGTGRIGAVFAKIMNGFGCKILAADIQENPSLTKDLNLSYVNLQTLLRQSDIISLHIPLTPQTRHIIDEKAFALMKSNVVIINTGRGALIDTKALITALKKQKIAGALLDVYEEEEGVFFSDLSNTGIQDDQLARLLTFPNVLLTSHQAFLTKEALTNIARTTLLNIQEFEQNKKLTNQVALS